MTSPIRPRRSALYMPGSNSRALEKAKSLPADCLILDLEDAVAPEKKQEARQQVATVISQGDFGYREVVVRINGFDTPWGEDDLAAIAPLAPDALLVPKVSTGAAVRDAAGRMEKHGRAQKSNLWVMMETPLALFNALEIAAFRDRSRRSTHLLRPRHQRPGKGYRRQIGPGAFADGRLDTNLFGRLLGSTACRSSTVFTMI